MRFAETPQDSPRPTPTMIVALRAVYRHSLPLLPHRSSGGYAIIREADKKLPRARLAWFSKQVGDRLTAESFIDSLGRMTDTGRQAINSRGNRNER